jgi:hypothetical protein
VISEVDIWRAANLLNSPQGSRAAIWQGVFRHPAFARIPDAYLSLISIGAYFCVRSLDVSNSLSRLQENGAPERSRTPNPQIRSLVLYPIELRAPAAKRAGDSGGNNYSRGTRKRKVDRGRRREAGRSSQAARDAAR